MNIVQLEHAAVGQPITRRGVSFIPVYIHQNGRPIASGENSGIVIAEQPDAAVLTLQARNDSPTPILLVEGETVIGGLQNRVLNVSVLVPAHSTVDIPVSCVEQGRWNGGGEFRRGRTHAPRRVRRATSGSVGRGIGHGVGSKRSDQGAVWSAVQAELTRLNTDSVTTSLDAAEQTLERDERLAVATDELVRMGPLPGQSGVVISHGSRIVAADVFANPDVFACHWEALVRSHMLDAPNEIRHRPSLTRAIRFLRGFAEADNTIAPGVGLGREHHVSNPKVTGHALVWDDVLVHASAFALAA